MNTLLTLIAIGFSNPTFAADPNTPHEHQGKAIRFTNPQPTKLTAEESAKLKTGEPVRKQVKKVNSGRGVAIMDIAADEKTIWSVITDFNSYSNWIDQLSECEIYKKEGQHIFSRFLISAAMMKIEYYIDHTYYPDKGYMTWHLDYSRQSDLDDSTGYWLTYPSPDDPTKTRLEYSIDLRTKGWIPKFVENMLANQGLEDGTKWVKKQSEKRAK